MRATSDAIAALSAIGRRTGVMVSVAEANLTLLELGERIIDHSKQTLRRKDAGLEILRKVVNSSEKEHSRLAAVLLLDACRGKAGLPDNLPASLASDLAEGVSDVVSVIEQGGAPLVLAEILARNQTHNPCPVWWEIGESASQHVSTDISSQRCYDDAVWPRKGINTTAQLAAYLSTALELLEDLSRCIDPNRQIGLEHGKRAIRNARRWLQRYQYRRFPDEPRSVSELDGETVEALLREIIKWIEDEGPADDAASEVSDTEKGITLFDVAFLIEEDDIAATEQVKKWSDSKRIQANPIGKCPLDGRRQLYRLSELLSDVKKILMLDATELAKYSQALKAKLRAPFDK